MLRTNQEVLKESHRLQDETKQTLQRIQGQLQQTEELGEYTLEGMKDQTNQMDVIILEGENTKDALQQSKKLHNKFDRWALNFGGRKRREAKKEAKEIQMAMDRDRQIRQLQKEQKKNNKDMNDITFENSNMPSSSYSSTVLVDNTNSMNTPVTSSDQLVNQKKRTTAKERHLLQQQEKEFHPLDEDCKKSLEQLDQVDNEIDAMVDETAASLERLMTLSKSIQEESHVQTQKTNTMTETMDRVLDKQTKINARVKGALTGKWKRRNLVS